MLFAPSGREAVIKLALPLVSATVASGVAPLLNVTLPVGTPAVEETVAVVLLSNISGALIVWLPVLSYIAATFPLASSVTRRLGSRSGAVAGSAPDVETQYFAGSQIDLGQTGEALGSEPGRGTTLSVELPL